MHYSDPRLSLFDELPALIWRAGPDGKCDYFNQYWLEFTGRTLEQEMGDGWVEGVHPNDREDTMQRYLAAFHQREPFEIEFLLMHYSGEYRWIQGYGRPYTDQHGNFAGYLGLCFDLTRRKTLERELRENEALFKGLFDYSPNAVLAVDRQGAIVLANRQFEEMFGYRQVDIIGKPLDILLPEKTRRAHGRHMQEYYQNPQVRPMGAVLSLYGLRKDGSLFPVDVSLSPVQVGNQMMVLAAVQDLTERKRVEYELKLHQEHLEDLVRMRTYELEKEVAERKRVEEKMKHKQSQLDQYARQLANSNRDLEDFAMVASHDLQEPLRKITAFSERLEEKIDPVLDETGRDYMNRIRDATTRMQTMLNDLMAYSRVNTLAQPSAQVDLNQVLAEVVSNLEIRIEASGGEVLVGDMPSIEADALHMKQLFQNLIANGLKFHKPGVPPVVRVTCELVGGRNWREERVQIMVEDNGIGMDEQYIDKIFQPFQRLHGRFEYEGSGMGLAICRKIVERHGGSIDVSSAEGQGTRFVIALPLVQEESTEPSQHPGSNRSSPADLPDYA
jgi:PAS domain S-box-containing protein